MLTSFKALRYQVDTWGALAGMLCLCLEVDTLGGDTSPQDPADILQVIEESTWKTTHFRILGAGGNMQLEDELELYALCQALGRRNFLIAADLPNDRPLRWEPLVGHRIAKVLPSEIIERLFSEVWLKVADPENAEPQFEKGLGNVIRYVQFDSRMSRAEQIQWLNKAQHSWGILWTTTPYQIMKELL